jgi:hypothetical protein
VFGTQFYSFEEIFECIFDNMFGAEIDFTHAPVVINIGVILINGSNNLKVLKRLFVHLILEISFAPFLIDTLIITVILDDFSKRLNSLIV